MPLSGPIVSQQIQRAYQAAQAALADARTTATAAGGALQTITSQQHESLNDLAAYYLPELTPAAISSTSSEVRQGIERIMLRQGDHVARLQTQIEQLEQRRTAADERAVQSTTALDEAMDAQQQLAEQLAEQLSQDADFRKLTERAAEAEAALERAEGSLEEIEHEALQKLPAYDGCRLFLYLYERGLGTPQYGYRGLTRRLDRWVSRLIEFPSARTSYEYLKQTPEHVRKLIAQDQQAFDAVMGELAKQRDELAAKLGLPEKINAVERADATHQADLEALAAVETELRTLNSELTTTADPQGSYYSEAIEYLRNWLARSDRDELAARAQQTLDPRDDQIIARLDHLDQQFRSANTEAVARQERIDWLANHLHALGQLQQRFRTAGYDSSRSQFNDSLDLTRDLELARDGRDTLDSIWERMRQQHQFAPSSLETAGSGLARVARHPMTHVLVHAMASAAANAIANKAMTGKARNAGRRYGRRR